MIEINNRQVGDGAPCFITYEAGPTHDGVDSAIELTRLAAEAGADAVKFQIFDPDRLCQDKKQLFSYSVLVDRETGKTEEVSEPLYDILCRRTLTHDEWRRVKKVAEEVDVTFFSTAAFEDDINFLESLGSDSIKIASADVTHHPLIRLAARTGQVIQLDTGNSTLGEIEEAVDVVLSEGNDRIIIHQCPSGYPARLESINLNIITTLKKMFGLPVAYSDHTPGWDMDIAALALGANMVEKTITKDRTTRSVEHIFSLEPADMRGFIQAIRDVETAMGSHRRLMTKEEREKSLQVRRSCYFRKDMKSGDLIKAEHIDFRRPGTGIGPDQFEGVLGRTLLVDVKAEDRVEWSQLSDS